MWNQQGCLAIGCGHMEMDGHARPSRCPHSQPAGPRPADLALQDFDRWVEPGRGLALGFLAGAPRSPSD